MALIAHYKAQTKKLRELAINRIGAEKAASMTDEEVAEWVDSNYAIFWGDDIWGEVSHEPTIDIIALIPSDVFHEIQESIVFIER